MYLSSVSSRILLYDTNSWGLKHTYGSYDNIARDLSWSDDGKYMLQVNAKGLVEILSTNDHETKTLQHVPFKDTWSASFHRDGHRNIAIGTKLGNVLIWDTKSKTITKTFPTPSQQSAINFVSFNTKNTSVAASMQNGDTIIYGLVSNIPVLTVKLPCSKSISGMKFHHESRALLGFATDEGHLVLRDITTNRDKVFFESVHASPVTDFAYSLVHKEVMLSCGYDKIVNVYDVRLQGIVSTIHTAYPLTSMSINVDSLVALGTKVGAVLVYDLRDLKNPFKVLRGHENEISKVKFQPVYKRTTSEDASLHNDTNLMSPNTKTSPVKTRISDLFFAVESPTPPRSNVAQSNQTNSNADSFLAMMGLDKSCNDLENGNLSAEDWKSEQRYKKIDAEKNVSKFSTPLTSKVGENYTLPSPICNANGINYDGLSAQLANLQMNTLTNSDKKILQDLESSLQSNFTKSLSDLDTSLKLALFDYSRENKHHYLNVMMVLTKQKLLLEKQLNSMNTSLVALTQNQNILLETVRKLSFEIELLKSKPMNGHESPN